MIGLVVLILVAGGLYMFFYGKIATNSALKPVVPAINPTSQTQSSPAAQIVTEANIDQTLDNTDKTMQKSINQATSDLNDVSKIDSTQDSTNGL